MHTRAVCSAGSANMGIATCIISTSNSARRDAFTHCNTTREAGATRSDNALQSRIQARKGHGACLGRAVEEAEGVVTGPGRETVEPPEEA